MIIPDLRRPILKSIYPPLPTTHDTKIREFSSEQQQNAELRWALGELVRRVHEGRPLEHLPTAVHEVIPFLKRHPSSPPLVPFVAPEMRFRRLVYAVSCGL
jgi:hypothetical protein